MATHFCSEDKILRSWRKNATPWTMAVRQKQIASREQITNQAIISAVLEYSPRTVLDLGCGEGWLARELSANNIHVIGVDAVPELIETAQQAGGGDFRTMSYEAIIAGELEIKADAVVCNFSLLGKESVEGIFNRVSSLLNESGSFIVQTLHPIISCGDHPYRDGWREGSWKGFDSQFSDPPPWYFRTLENWIELFVNNGFRLREVREPIQPQTQMPASVIFIGNIDP